MKNTLKFLMLIILINFSVNAQEDKLSDSLSVDYLISLSLEELLDVKVVTAAKTLQKITDVPASVVIISRKEIERYGFQSVEEILSNIPGLYLIDDYIWTGSKNFGVRGFFSTGALNDLIVLIDGVNQKIDILYDSYSTEKIALPVEAIDRIEVIRGPMSVVYGSGAFFGAINIITKNNSKNSFDHYVSASIGSLETKKVFARFSGETGEFDFALNGSIYEDDGINVPFSKLMNDISVVNKPAEEGGWNLNKSSTGGLLKTKRKNFNLSGNYKNIKVNVGIVNSKKNTVESMFGAGDGNFVYFNSANFSIRMINKFSDKFELNTQYTYSFDNHWVDNEFQYKFAYTNNWARMSASELTMDAHLIPLPKLKISAGLYLRHIDDWFVVADYPLAQFADTEISIDEISTYAAYSQVEYNFTEKLKLIGGLRIEKNEPYDISVIFPLAGNYNSIPVQPFVTNYNYKPENDIEFIPRFAAVYSINKNYILKFLYGKAIKQPSANSNLDMVFSPGPTLKPSEIQTFEFNFLGSIFSNLFLNCSIFRNQLDNLITRLNVIDPEQGLIIISSNAGKMNTTGFEFGLKINPLPKLNMDFNFTYQKSENVMPGFSEIDLGYSPNLLGYLKASYEFSEHITLSLLGRYVDRMESEWDRNYIDDNNKPIKTNNLLQGRIGLGSDSYYIFSSNLLIQNFILDGFRLNLKINNILDEEVFFPTTTSNPQFDKGTMAPGRTFLLSVGYKF